MVGGVKWGNGLVKTDSVLALYGTSRKQELEILKVYENNDMALSHQIYMFGKLFFKTKYL